MTNRLASFRVLGITSFLLIVPLVGALRAEPDAEGNDSVRGNLGVGTSIVRSGFRLEVTGPSLFETGGSGGEFHIGTPNGETGMGVVGTNRADLRFDGSALKLVAGLGAGPPPATNGIVVTTAGNVGVGTLVPRNGFRLDVTGSSVFRAGGNGGEVHIGTPNGESGLGIVGANRADLRFDGANLKLVVGPGNSPPPEKNGLTVNTSGDVTIGSSLAVAGGGLTVPNGGLKVGGPAALNGGASVGGSASVNGSLTVFGAIFFREFGGVGQEPLCFNGNSIARCGSSLRYKTEVADYEPGLSVVDRLRPIRFAWKESGAPDVGFAAEDVERVEPLLTTHDTAGELVGVKYAQISAVLVNAIQEQQKQIEQLHGQVESLQRLICIDHPDASFCSRH